MTFFVVKSCNNFYAVIIQLFTEQTTTTTILDFTRNKSELYYKEFNRRT